MVIAQPKKLNQMKDTSSAGFCAVNAPVRSRGCVTGYPIPVRHPGNTPCGGATQIRLRINSVTGFTHRFLNPHVRN